MSNTHQPAQFDWATELSDAQGHVTLSAQEAKEIGARLRSMGAKLKSYEDLGDATNDMQLLRMGYAAARMEIESLKAQLHAAKQINADQFELLAASIPGSALRASHEQAQAQPISLQGAHDAVTIDTLNDRVMYLEAQLAEARAQAAPGEPSAFPMTGDEEESDLGQWQPGTAKPNMDGTYLREFDEGEATSEFHQGVWLRDGFFPSELQDVRWRGRAAPQQEAQEPCPTCVALARTVMLDQVSFDRAVLAKWGMLRADRIVIPTDTMEQEFQKHYQRGYAAGQKASATQPTQAQAGAVPLTDEQIDAVAESMPGGLAGFLKGWGWRQFAREILTLRRMPDWEPQFDCMTPKQEELAIQFFQEIAGPRGERGSPPDPVRLLEMAEALYKAEREHHHGIKGGQHGTE